MKRLLILAALAAVTLIGTAATPVQAKSLREREHHLQNRMAKYRQKYVKKQAKWGRNHPHATNKQVKNLLKWDRKYARKGEKLTNKEHRVASHLARKHARHH